MAVMAMSLRVVVPPHPLIAHWLTLLRDRHTPDALYGSAMAELGQWLTYEGLRDWLPHQSLDVETPLGAQARGEVVDGSIPLLAVPVLPGGLGLWQGARRVLPNAHLSLLALQPQTDGPPRWSLDGLPERIGSRVGVLAFLPCIATGRSALAVLDRLGGLGVNGDRLRLITALASAPGLRTIGERHGDLTLYCGCIDPDLDGEGRILPGIGSIEERLHGLTPQGCLG
jgi:uracil phosphoribosyltransferase